jgi:hypothetical protein
MPNRERLLWFTRLSVKIGTSFLCSMFAVVRTGTIFGGGTSETFGMGAWQVNSGIPVLRA